MGTDHLSSQALPVTHPTPAPPDKAGPMAGTTVVELADEFCAFAGRLLADAGADVIVVEPPGGAAQRGHQPFADNVVDGTPDSERSLSWWAENTSKRSIVVDLETEDGRALFGRLVARADVLLEAEKPGRLASLGLGYEQLGSQHPQLVHVAITPFGQAGIGGSPEVTDLTVLARGGPMWSCGYDDHELPPVRGRGNQGIRMAAHFAVMSTLTALLFRDGPGGRGQFVDVSMNAAANTTTEFASYGWLAGQQTVQRQTGRHATPEPTEATQVQCGDGRYLNTGVPPRRPREFESLLNWITELGLGEEFPMTSLLELGTGYDYFSLAMIMEDPLVGEIFQAGREAMSFIASKLSAHDAFIGFQRHGIACGVVWSPDEVMTDPHFVERGFPVEVEQEQLGRSVTYPGAPIRFTESPMSPRRRAPLLDEHSEEIRAELETG